MALTFVTLTLVGLAPGRAHAAEGGQPVVLVLVPELRWADAPVVLHDWAKTSVSLRSARPRAVADDGYLTIGKGARSGAPTDTGVGPVLPTGDGGLRLERWEELRRHDRSLGYSGELGTLGEALRSWGRPWTLVADDERAAAAVADRRGLVPRAERGGAAAVARLLGEGAQAVIVAVPGDQVAPVAGAAAGACVVVASVSSPGRTRHLGVLAASPPCGLGDQGLTSPGTHQDHLATLVDVGPTFLAQLGVPRPAGMGGSPVEPSGPVSVADLVRRDERVVAADRARTPLVCLFVALTGAAAVLALRRPSARPAAAYALLAVPPTSFLVMAVPWWRWGLAGALLAGAAIAAVLAVAAAYLGRHDVRIGVGALAAVTAAVIGVDAAFGGPLEIDAPFGNSPVVAGRFYGVGNIGSGFLAAAIVLGAGLALDRWGRRALSATGAAMAAGVVMGGAPWFGADVGGVLSAVPAYGTLVAGWRSGRPSVRIVLPLLAAALVVLALFVAVDLSRPAGERTHLGRVVGQDLAGDVGRKAGKALATVINPMALVVLIGGGVLAAVRPDVGRRPALQVTAWALAVAGVLGSALNDSGLLVGAAVMAMAWPAFLLLGGPSTAPVPPAAAAARAANRVEAA
ncbi:MAG TPA: hypothetical protein VHF24_10760 [Acidimicrobiales bacterium]|nr:hypothetical protein [Acidimicrobiales bacterium]